MDVKKIKHGEFDFISIGNPKDTALRKLVKAYNFNPLDLEDFENKTQISKVEVYENYSLIVLDFPLFSTTKIHFEGTAQEQKAAGKLPIKFVKSTVSSFITLPAAALSYTLPDQAFSEKKKIFHSQVYFFIGKDYCLILHDNELQIIDEIFEICSKNSLYRDELMGKGPLFFAYRTIDALVDLCFPIVNELSSNIEKIDRKLEGKKSQDLLEEISVTRRNLVYFQTIIKPFNQIFRNLEEGRYAPLDGDMKGYWSNISDHIQNLSSRLDDNRELIEGISESYESLITSKNNEIIAFLTIIFTLTVPATVLGSFYGMNILLPGGIETGPFTFWGPYTMFFIIIILSILPILIMLIYFKFKRWI